MKVDKNMKLEKNSNRKVIYKNIINDLIIELKPAEIDLLMTIISLSRNNQKNKELLIIPAKQLKQIAKYKNTSTKAFEDQMKKAMVSFIKSYSDYKNSKGFGVAGLFEDIFYNKECRQLELKPLNEFYSLIDDLLSDFTVFELKEFVSLKSIYAKEIYRRLKQFRTTGWWRISIKDFRLKIRVPSSYKMIDIDRRVLNPALVELKPIFKSLKIDKIKDSSKQGQPVVALEFNFTPEKVSSFNPNKYQKNKNKNPKNINLSEKSFAQKAREERLMRLKG